MSSPKKLCYFSAFTSLTVTTDPVVGAVITVSVNCTSSTVKDRNALPSLHALSVKCSPLITISLACFYSGTVFQFQCLLTAGKPNYSPRESTRDNAEERLPPLIAVVHSSRSKNRRRIKGVINLK